MRNNKAIQAAAMAACLTVFGGSAWAKGVVALTDPNAVVPAQQSVVVLATPLVISAAPLAMSPGGSNTPPIKGNPTPLTPGVPPPFQTGPGGSPPPPPQPVYIP